MTHPHLPRSRFLRLAGFCLLVFAAFAVLHWWPPAHRYGHRQDELIVGGIGILFLVIGLGMIPRTAIWGAREVGLWGVSLGLGIWFTAVVWNALYQTRDVSWPPPEIAVLQDVIRALFICGGLFLAWAYVFYWKDGGT